MRQKTRRMVVVTEPASRQTDTGAMIMVIRSFRSGHAVASRIQLMVEQEEFANVREADAWFVAWAPNAETGDRDCCSLLLLPDSGLLYNHGVR